MSAGRQLTARRRGTPLVLFASLALVASACGGRSVVPTPPEGWPAIRLMNEEVVDPTSIAGTWAQRQVVTTETRVPLTGTVRATSTTLLLLKVTQDGADATVVGHICDLHIESGSALADTVVPDAFVRAMPPREAPARFEAVPDAVETSPEDRIETSPVETAPGGYRFLQQPAHEVLGANLTGPDDPLPTDPADPRVVDSDGDGDPGVTIEVTGLSGGRMFLVQRAWRELESRSVTPTTIDGVIRWGFERAVLGATSRMLRNQRESAATTDPAQNHFRTTRVRNDTDCAAIVAAGPALFER